MDTWNEICAIINKHKEGNSAENFFQNDIEHVFRILGWSISKNEILPKQAIRVGAVKFVYPDIIINNANEHIIVVELKKPNQPSTKLHIEQLTGYMRLLKLTYGIFIGQNIQLYYDDPNDKEIPIKIFETSFIENNIEGSRFIGLLSKQTFSESSLQEFCDEKLEEVTGRNIANSIIERLTSDEGIEKILNYLSNDLSNDYNDNIVKIILDNLSIKISKKHTEVPINAPGSSIKSHDILHDKLPIEIIPNDVEAFKKKFIEIGHAILCFHYLDGHIEEKTWERKSFIESSGLKGNLRGRPEARKGKWKELGIVKLICKIKD